MFDIKIGKQKKQIVLVLNNALGHKPRVTKNIKLIFLPANSTGILQHLDAGIIRSFKAHYRRHVLNFIMEMNEGKDFIINLFKKITIKDEVIFTKLAWDDVQQACQTRGPRICNTFFEKFGP